MPRTLTIIIGILLFAAATAFLYGWGMIKASHKQTDLYQRLFLRGEKAVLGYLKSHDFITLSKTETLVANLKASLFYSRTRIVVRDKADFARQLLKGMVQRGMLQETRVKGKNAYRKTERKVSK